MTTTKASIQSDLVGELIDRVFSGSAGRLVMKALEEGAATPEELEQIRAMLEE